MKNKTSKIDRLKIALGLEKKHSHDRENARCRRQIEKGIIKVTAVLLLFHAWPSWASESYVPVVSPSSQQVSISYDREAPPSKTVEVKVEVEGLSDPPQEYTETFPLGSTTADVLKSHHHIVRGMICLDNEGVLSVDGVGDYRHGDYWAVSVNGDYVNTNSHTILKTGDLVRWKRILV